MIKLFSIILIGLAALLGMTYFAVEYIFGHPGDGDPNYAVNQILKEVP